MLIHPSLKEFLQKCITNTAISLSMCSNSLNITCGDFTFSGVTDLQAAILLKTEPFCRFSSRIQVSVCSDIKQGLICTPFTHVLCWSSSSKTRHSKLETATEKYPRETWVMVQDFLLYSLSASVSGVLEKYLLGSSSWAMTADVQCTSLLKTDYDFRYHLRIHMFMYAYNFTDTECTSVAYISECCLGLWICLY